VIEIRNAQCFLYPNEIFPYACFYVLTIKLNMLMKWPGSKMCVEQVPEKFKTSVL
jgi:hypothetical protein